MALPLEERPRNANALSFIRSLTSSARTSERMRPFALDGTVTSNIRMHIDDEDELKRNQQAFKVHQSLIQSLGPLTSVDVEIDLTGTGPGGRHMFLNNLVEMTIDIDTPELRAAGIAAHSFCVVKFEPESSRIAVASGVSTQDFHNGNFALVSTEWLDEQRGQHYDLMIHRVAQQTMPARVPIARFQYPMHTEEELTNANKSIDALKAACTKSIDSPTYVFDQLTTLVMHVPARAFFSAPWSIKNLAKRLTNEKLSVGMFETRMPSHGPAATHVTMHITNANSNQ